MESNLRDRLNHFGKIGEPFLFVISYDMSEFFVEKLVDLPSGIEFEIDSNAKSMQKTSLQKEPLPFSEYMEKFQSLLTQLQNGNTYLANLTCISRINPQFSLDEIYKNAKSMFKLRFKNFVCFSPERFVKIEGSSIFTTPMKGTIDASLPNAKEKLLGSKKEFSEHTMVVDLLRNDLGMVGTDVKVDEFRYVQSVVAGDKELLQTSSKISAKLSENWHERIGDILCTILPAGSITGTPKRSTVDILKRVEGYERGFYCGIFGVFDGKNLDSAVMIRFVQEEDGEMFYKSGGGITGDSDVNEEYQEMCEKIYLPF